jgi:hypothetical protein
MSTEAGGPARHPEIPGVHLGGVEGGPPFMTLSALLRDTSRVRAAGSSFLLFLKSAFDFSFISNRLAT